MRQLITRVEDDLHRKLKVRARAEGQSMNRLVVDLLRSGLAQYDERQTVSIRLREAGLDVTYRPETKPPSREEAITSTVGAGRAASEALERDRGRV